MANFGLFSEIATNCYITSVAEAGSFLKCEEEEVEEEEAGVVFNHVLRLDCLSDGACVSVVIHCSFLKLSESLHLYVSELRCGFCSGNLPLFLSASPQIF